MLAKTFKTAKDLKLRQEVYDALVKVYWMLSDEVIPAHLFDMGDVGHPKLTVEGELCGSAGCIHGWCQAVLDQDAENCIDLQSYSHGGIKGPRALNALCYSHLATEGAGPVFRKCATTRQQAAQALNNYLTTGHANWRSVLKG